MINNNYQKMVKEALVAYHAQEDLGEVETIFPNSISISHADIIRECPPGTVESYKYYWDNVEMQDWGGVYVIKVKIAGIDIFITHVFTDGDDGWMEIYDAENNCHGIARRYIDLLHWGEKDDIRSMTESGDYPAELEKRMDAIEY